MFILFGIVVPAISHFVFACAPCDRNHQRPYDNVVQLSLSSVATVSFLCLSWFVRKFGLKRFLFFDKLYHESETVRREYTAQLNCSMHSGAVFMALPDNRVFPRLCSVSVDLLPPNLTASRFRQCFKSNPMWDQSWSQFALLLITTKSHAGRYTINFQHIFIVGELVLCSITLVTGLLILLRSATKITHTAQAVACLATKWHVCATLESFDATELDSPTAQ
ncbi:hypothetical protein ACLB2K_026116 [Fragaria x ananassa]